MPRNLHYRNHLCLACFYFTGLWGGQRRQLGGDGPSPVCPKRCLLSKGHKEFKSRPELLGWNPVIHFFFFFLMLTTLGQLCGLRKWLALSETWFPCLWNKDSDSVNLTGLFWGCSEKLCHTAGCSAVHSVVPNSLQPCGLQPARLLCPRDFLGKYSWAGCHFLLLGIFPTQGLNLLRLLHCRRLLYPLSHEGSLGAGPDPWHILMDMSWFKDQPKMLHPQTCAARAEPYPNFSFFVSWS